MVSTPPPFFIFRAGRVKILITMKTYSTSLIIKEVHIRMRYYCFSITGTGMKGINHAHYWWGSVTDLRGGVAFCPHSYSALLWDLALSAPMVYKSSCKPATNPCSSFAFVWKELKYVLRAKSVALPRTARLLSSLCSPPGFITVTNWLHASLLFSILKIKKCFPDLLPPPDPE